MTPTETGAITDTAAASANELDPNPADNSATETTTVNPAAGLTLTLADSPDPVLAGQPLTYTATVTNAGPSAASGVTLADTLAASVVFDSAMASQGTCNQAAGTVSCDLGTLPAGAAATVAITVRPTETGPITDTAAAGANEGDPNPADDSATEATTVDPAADLAVTMTDSPDPVPVGQTLVYTTTVTNNGPSGAVGVTLTDTLPSSVVFVSATWTRTGGGGSCSQAAGTVTCALGGFVPPGVIVTITVTTTRAETITNRATVTGAHGDPFQANNTATATTTVTFVDGKIAFATRRDGNFEIYSVNPNGTALTRLTTNTASDLSPAWSPDGTKLAFQSDRDGNLEIYVMNADGTGQTRLTNKASIDMAPAWSPDGTKLAFESTRDGNLEIYLMNADGTGQTRLTFNAAIDTDPTWSPDGTKLAFDSTRDGPFHIYLMNANGSAQTRRTSGTANDVEPAWSPVDGSKIVFASTHDGNVDIYMLPSAPPPPCAKPPCRAEVPTRLTSNAAIDSDPAWQRLG